MASSVIYPDCLKSIIKVKYLSPDATKISMPKEGDFGIDLYALEDLTLYPNSTYLIKTGVSFSLPSGYGLIIKDRSSKSEFYQTLAGVIDNLYTGEVLVRALVNGNNPYTIKAGEKIAQALVMPILTTHFRLEEVEELRETERGNKGFGSTGF